VIDQLLKKTLRASEETGITTIVLGGGVARNSRLRHLFGEHCAKKGLKIYLPSPIMCTDNAAMIAGLGLVKYRKHGPSPMSLDADPRMGLE
jgi:N6-L-threonylcarbamoyladenine synthase